MRTIIIICIALLCLAAPLAAKDDAEANLVYVSGRVTHLLVADLDTIVVTANGQDILLPCPQVKFPGCLALSIYDKIKFFGRFGPIVEDCSEPGPTATGLESPLEADDIQLCDDEGDCHTLSDGYSFSSKE